MKKIICMIAAMMLAVIPLSACESAGADSESQVSGGASETELNLLLAPEAVRDNNYMPLDGAIEIVNDFFERRSNVTLHFMSTADIEVDKTHTIPDNSDYVLVTDEALKDCHSINDLKAYVETAYTNNYAEKHLYPAYLYEGDDGKPRFMEYNGNLYVNEKTASTVAGSIAEIDYDTFYVSNYNADENLLQVKYDEYIPDYSGEGKDDEWSYTYCLTLIKEDDVWKLDNAGVLMTSNGGFTFESDTRL